nr:MAG TPA: hypothetical protein [Crassvirales sp.]
MYIYYILYIIREKYKYLIISYLCLKNSTQLLY